MSAIALAQPDDSDESLPARAAATTELASSAARSSESPPAASFDEHAEGGLRGEGGAG